MLRVVGSALFWSFLVVTSALFFFPLAVLIWLCTVAFDRRLAVLHRFTCFWGGIYPRLNPAWPITIEGREKIRRGETYVMVSNHVSLLDILVLFCLDTHFKWVSKAENFKLPFIGWNMRLNRYIELRRGERASVLQMFKACDAALQGGSSIMMFPEGTRSVDGKLRPFKEGAFELAIRNRVPILLLTVEGTGEALPTKGVILQGRHPIRVRVLGEIAADALGDDAAALTERVRDELGRALGQA